MRKKVFIVFVALVTLVLVTTLAFGWRSVRTGQKNFERAWSAMHFKRAEKTQDYFVKAANSFGEALAEQPPSRTTMFPSNLTMAGISLYYAGRDQECINAMDLALRKSKRIWEGHLYKGLAYLTMRDKKEGIAALTAYIQSSPGQPILSAAVEKELTNLETDSGTIDDAIAHIEDAIIHQYRNNETLQSTPTEQDQCSGQFWWRYNKAPCSEELPFSRS